MARPISWLHRVRDIHRAAVSSSSSHFDRSDLERLFQIQSRAAGKLMELLPRSDALGNSHLVERLKLIEFLERVQQADDVPAALDQVRKENPGVNRRRKIQALRREDGMLVPKKPQAADAIGLSRGRLELQWKTFEEFMEGLFHLVVQVHGDEEAFVREYCIEPPKPRDRDLDAALEEIRRTNDEFDAWMLRKRVGVGVSTDTHRGTSSKPGVHRGIESRPDSLSLRHTPPEDKRKDQE